MVDVRSCIDLLFGACISLFQYSLPIFVFSKDQLWLAVAADAYRHDISEVRPGELGSISYIDGRAGAQLGGEEDFFPGDRAPEAAARDEKKRKCKARGEKVLFGKIHEIGLRNDSGILAEIHKKTTPLSGGGFSQRWLCNQPPW